MTCDIHESLSSPESCGCPQSWLLAHAGAAHTQVQLLSVARLEVLRGDRNHLVRHTVRFKHNSPLNHSDLVLEIANSTKDFHDTGKA